VFTDDLDPCGLQEASAVLSVQMPKTRRRGARRQHLLVTDPLLLQWLRRACERSLRDQYLLPYSPATARRRLVQMMSALGLPPHHYTWASLRAGGASFEYISGRPVEALRLRGRWSAAKSLEHYVQECLSYLDTHALPQASWRKVVELSGLADALVRDHMGSAASV
jgi:hypothetical protein